MNSVKLFAAAIGWAVAAAAAPAMAAVIGATVADASSGDYTLTSVSVTRGGAGTFTYVPSQLTGVDLTDVAAVSLPFLAPGTNASIPAPGTRATLLEDGRLDSGVLSPFSAANPALNSFEVTFLQPIVNSAGEDIVVFEIGALESTLFFINNDNDTTDGVDRHEQIDAADFATNLLQVNYSLFSYNNGGDQTVDDLGELESATGYQFDSNGVGVGVSAVGLDLSDFGVAPGATIASLRFQSINTNRIDPVFIAGLPAVPEPAGVALLGLGGTALLLRRKRLLM
jgi:hypothetical protein